MKIKPLFLIPFVSFIVSFKSETISNNSLLQKAPSQNLNISFLLDLSDRIDPKKHPNPTMEFYQRDIQYIKSVQKAFLECIKRKKILLLNDQMQVFFEPEPQNAEINKLSQQLRVGFDKTTSKNAIISVDKIFSAVPVKIYQAAIKDNQFIGADIWGFFKNKVNNYCIKPNHRNILFILTDGYMFHEDSKFIYGSKSSYLTPLLVKSLKLNTPVYQEVMRKKGYGFIKANDNLSNLEVFVLGVNPAKGNPFEGDVIKAYWANWLKDMKVKSFEVKFTDLPSSLDPVIQKFINQ